MTFAESAGPCLTFDLDTQGGMSETGAFGLDVARVLRVIEPTAVAPVPLAPKVVRGIINHHGRIVTVVDPAPILGMEDQRPEVAQVIVLRDGQRSTGNIGLQVLRIRRIVPAAGLKQVDVPGKPCVAWVAQHGQRVIDVLHVDSLLEGLAREFGITKSAESSEGVTI